MLEHPLVPRMRFYLGLVVAGMVACLSPEWGLLLAANCFGWWKGSGCCGSACNGCSSTAPSQFQVVISGISNSTHCTDCSQYNGTWTVTSSTDYCTNIGGCGANFCFWNYQINPCFCVGPSGFAMAADQAQAVNQIFLLIAGSGTIQVIFAGNQIGSNCHTFAGIWSSYFFWSSAGGTLDCANLSSHSVPLSSQSSSGCTSDTTAALVTAI